MNRASAIDLSAVRPVFVPQQIEQATVHFDDRDAGRPVKKGVEDFRPAPASHDENIRVSGQTIGGRHGPPVQETHRLHVSGKAMDGIDRVAVQEQTLLLGNGEGTVQREIREVVKGGAADDRQESQGAETLDLLLCGAQAFGLRKVLEGALGRGDAPEPETVQDAQNDQGRGCGGPGPPGG